MDLKYVFISKLLILYGVIGILFTGLFSLIASFISCGKNNDDIYDIYDYICKVVDDNGDRFLESYYVYFNGNFWNDILKTLLGYIGIALVVLFLFQIVQYLNPIYKSFSSPFSYFI